MSETIAKRPTYAEINLENLVFNLQSVKDFIGEKISYMAVVKADAYGHGAVCCARKFEQAGIEWLGVALPEEGLELRENNLKTRILCLGGFWPGQENILLDNNLTPVVFKLQLAGILDKAAKIKGVVADIHVKIDTGMGRIGVRFDEVEDFADNLKKFENLRVEGLMTHFAAADNLQENAFTDLQIDRFYKAVDIFEEKGFQPVFKDLANSPGAVAHENSRGNMVRLGGVLYGLGGDVLPAEIVLPRLKAVMSIHSEITHLKKVPKGESLGYGRTFKTEKDSLIATIPIGYQDGYKRSLSNLGKVIVNDRFAPVAGRISMDWTIVDVSDVPDIKIGDHIHLIGESGDLKVTAEDLARITGTISYEITCGIHRRVIRKYTGA